MGERLKAKYRKLKERLGSSKAWSPAELARELIRLGFVETGTSNGNHRTFEHTKTHEVIRFPWKNGTSTMADGTEANVLEGIKKYTDMK